MEITVFAKIIPNTLLVCENISNNNAKIMETNCITMKLKSKVDDNFFVS
jgi:hypothetical protein